VRDYIFNPAENKFEHKDELVHVSSSELKAGTPAHKLRYPERYKSGYVDWWDRDDKLKEKIMQTRVSDRDTVKSHVKNIGHTKFLSKDKLKYLKPNDKGSEIKLEVKAPTYFPTNERMPETPPPNFEKPVDLDLFKGLGSLLATTRKDFIKK